MTQIESGLLLLANVLLLMNYEVGDNFATRTMGDEKPIRVRPTRSSFTNNVQLQTSQVDNIGNTVAFGWANAIFSLAYALAFENVHAPCGP